MERSALMMTTFMALSLTSVVSWTGAASCANTGAANAVANRDPERRSRRRVACEEEAIMNVAP